MENFWIYLSIPTISAIVGMTTNWLAVQMTFYPVNFIGIGPIGWQGIIPRNSNKMAKIAVDASMRKLITVGELVDKIDPNEMIAAAQIRIDQMIEDIVEELMQEQTNNIFGVISPAKTWSLTPLKTKQLIYAEIRKELPSIVEGFVGDLKHNVDELIDINQITISKLAKEKALLNDIFLLAARKEFDFLIRSGLYFGFPLGIPIMFIWHALPVWWLLPLCGLMIGGLTNKLAMYLVRAPLYPQKIGPFTILGLFIKRQQEVARIYGEVYAEHLVNSEILFQELMRTGSSNKLFDLLQRRINTHIEQVEGYLKPLVVLTLGSKEHDEMKNRICDKVFSSIKNSPPKEVFEYTDKALDIVNVFTDKIGGMSPEDFEGLLRPAVEQDEWKLVAVGAALGAVAGYLQWLTIAG